MSEQDAAVVTVWLPPGTVVRVDGIPLRLAGECGATTHPNNVRLLSPQVVAANAHLLGGEANGGAAGEVAR